jgi:putative oxidoreductase
MQSTRSFQQRSSAYLSQASSSLIRAAIIFHNFWKETDATAKQNEQIAFNKDLSLAGAALILFALVATGALTDFGPSVGTLAFFNL